jgi:hypothetical protein
MELLRKQEEHVASQSYIGGIIGSRQRFAEKYTQFEGNFPLIHVKTGAFGILMLYVSG